MSKFSRIIGGSPQYSATQLPLDKAFVQQAEDTHGSLLRIWPFKENEDILGATGLLRSVHDVTTNFRGKNTSDHHSFELWFDEGKIKFYMHAATDAAADKFRRRVGNNYANSEVFRVEDGVTFPVIKSDEYVAGARLGLKKIPYYPIRHHANEEFETDPYGEITSEMLSLDDSKVVVQVVFLPAKQSWTDGDRFKHNSVEELAEAHRNGTSVGWLNPRTRPANETDKQIAKTVAQQRGKQAFHANIRILAVSADPSEAEARARGVAGMFKKLYWGVTEQGFEDTPIWHRKETKRANKLHQHIERMADRDWSDQRMILTIDELAGVAHIPSGDIETPNIDWRHTQRGDRVPADAGQHDRQTTSDEDDDSSSNRGNHGV